MSVVLVVLLSSSLLTCCQAVPIEGTQVKRLQKTLDRPTSLFLQGSQKDSGTGTAAGGCQEGGWLHRTAPGSSQ